MIQRVQTIFLGSATVMLIVVTASMNRIGADTDPMATAAMLISGSLAIISLGSVFLFARRERQQQIVHWARMGCIILLLSIGLLLFSGEKYLTVLSGQNVGLIVATLASLVALWLLSRAATAIRKDILLIKSVDRIR